MDVHGSGSSNPMHGEIEEIEDEIDKRFKKFKNFDVATYPPLDHQYNNSKIINRNSFCGVGSTTSKIQQEWKTLETNLPSSILVRACNRNRLYLMRAVVIGPPGTPYYHGLFFFDILLPSNYPTCPPKLFYRSQGVDLNNPNLQPDGKVFLSLLEKGEEGWDPNQSNLLQVLVSIQRLVLNSKPYLNEYEEHEYTRNTYTMTCEAIVRTLEKPPMHFEDFVAGHFRQRAHAILMKYKEHMDESEGMARLFIKLLRALEANGAYGIVCKNGLFGLPGTRRYALHILLRSFLEVIV